MARDTERFQRRGSSPLELYVRELVRSAGKPARRPGSQDAKRLPRPTDTFREQPQRPDGRRLPAN